MGNNSRMLFIDVINGYHIKSKHDVFSDGTKQPFLTSACLGWYNLSSKKMFSIVLQHSHVHCVSFVLFFAIV